MSSIIDMLKEAALPQNRLKRLFVYYVLWIVIGTFCFAFADWSHTSGLALGYYCAINVGYSIGWSYPAQEDGPQLLFSSFYLLFGAGFVSLALGVYADSAMKDRENWYSKLMKRKEYEEQFENIKGEGSFTRKAALFYDQYQDTILPVFLCIAWLIVMMLNGYYQADLPFYTDLYFALTSLSTGGMVGMEPENLWSFVLHAFLSSIGIPLFAFTMGQLGMLSLTWGGDEELEQTQKTIAEPIIAEELEFLARFGLENGDGQIDRDEFMILCMVRMGIDVQLLEFISKRFEQLDADGSGYLSIPEVTDGRYYLDKTGKIAPIEVNHLSNEEIQKLMAAAPQDDPDEKDMGDSERSDIKTVRQMLKEQERKRQERQGKIKGRHGHMT